MGESWLNEAVCRQIHELWVTVGYMKLCVERDQLLVAVGHMKVCVDRELNCG